METLDDSFSGSDASRPQEQPAGCFGCLVVWDSLADAFRSMGRQLRARRLGRPLTRRGPLFGGVGAGGAGSAATTAAGGRTPSLFGEAKDRLGPYEMKSTLGEGTFSKVKLAQHAVTGEYFAIKFVRRSEHVDDNDDNQPLVENQDAHKLHEVFKDFRREIDILKAVRHPNIVELHEMFETDKYFIVVLEYCPGGDLFEAVSQRGEFDEAQVKLQFRQIAQAVKVIHDKDIAHRDLKLENILLDKNGNVKIGDFGLARFVPAAETDMLSTFCGSPDYAAPEVLRGIPYNGKMSDVWSLGVILYALVTGCFPFEQRRDALEARYNTPDSMPAPCAELIEHILRLQPHARFTIDQILEHPWLRDEFSGFASSGGSHSPRAMRKATKVSSASDKHIPHTIVSL